MRVGIVGYRNHAERLRGLLLRDPEVSSLVIFHPEEERLTGLEIEASISWSTSSRLSDLHDCDAVMVSSPSSTHHSYVRALIEHVPYVFCEKPIAVTQEEMDWFRGLPTELSGRIYCNQNYALTRLAKRTEEVIGTNELGKPVHFEFTATHGLAFQDGFADNWRFQVEDVFASIIGNLGIHYIHLILKLLGDQLEIHCMPLRAKHDHSNPDACSICFQMEGGQTAFVHLSYAAPYMNTARLFFTDGLLVLDDGKVHEFAPRDTFDEFGRFASPLGREICSFPSTKAYFDDSLAASLEYFLRIVKSKASFPSKELARAVGGAEVVLDVTRDLTAPALVSPVQSK
tara:strand:+ start:3638 stop:4666 length:1029 start_codon:yes stop_codon:yes gene_type:complete